MSLPEVQIFTEFLLCAWHLLDGEDYTPEQAASSDSKREGTHMARLRHPSEHCVSRRGVLWEDTPCTRPRELRAKIRLVPNDKSPRKLRAALGEKSELKLLCVN